MSCIVEQRYKANAAAAAVEDRPAVAAVDVLAPQEDPTDRWTLDIVCNPETEGLPPALLDRLSAFGLSVRMAGPQGGTWQAIAVLG